MGFGWLNKWPMKRLLTILFFIPVFVHSQTRFYFDRLLTAPISPTVNAAWNITSTNTYTMIFPSKSQFSLLTTGVSITSGASGAASPKTLLSGTLISQPLVAQTIASGSTISMQMRLAKNGSTQVTNGLVYIRYCNEDGTNIQEIGNVASTNLPGNTTLTNRTFSFTLGSNITLTDGQRLIFEVGQNYTSGVATTITGSFSSAIQSNTTDLPVDNTTTTALLPWIEFSQTLKFRYGGGFQ